MQTSLVVRICLGASLNFLFWTYKVIWAKIIISLCNGCTQLNKTFNIDTSKRAVISRGNLNLYFGQTWSFNFVVKNRFQYIQYFPSTQYHIFPKKRKENEGLAHLVIHISLKLATYSTTRELLGKQLAKNKGINNSCCLPCFK